MKFNTKIIYSKGFSVKEAGIMVLIGQNANGREEEALAMEFSDEIIDKFRDKGITKLVNKKRRSDSDFYRMRLTTQGKRLLKMFTEKVEAEESDEDLLQWLISIYKKKGKEVGNTKRTKEYLVRFREETGIERNHLAFLFQQFLSSDRVEEGSNVLEYALFYPKKFSTDGGRTIAYEAKWDIEDSWLYRFYREREEWFNKQFANIKN